jgi:sec-independent protein translocase protein TatA
VNIARLFEGPVGLILILVLIAVFAGPKLPGAARGIAQSIKVFKKELNGDDKPADKKDDKPKSEDEK